MKWISCETVVGCGISTCTKSILKRASKSSSCTIWNRHWLRAIQIARRNLKVAGLYVEPCVKALIAWFAEATFDMQFSTCRTRLLVDSSWHALRIQNDLQIQVLQWGNKSQFDKMNSAYREVLHRNLYQTMSLSTMISGGWKWAYAADFHRAFWVAVGILLSELHKEWSTQTYRESLLEILYLFEIAGWTWQEHSPHLELESLSWKTPGCWEYQPQQPRGWDSSCDDICFLAAWNPIRNRLRLSLGSERLTRIKETH